MKFPQWLISLRRRFNLWRTNRLLAAVRKARDERLAHLEMCERVLGRQAASCEKKFPEIARAALQDQAATRAEIELIKGTDEEYLYARLNPVLLMRAHGLKLLTRRQSELDRRIKALQTRNYGVRMKLNKLPADDARRAELQEDVARRDCEVRDLIVKLRAVESEISNLNSPNMGFDWTEVLKPVVGETVEACCDNEDKAGRKEHCLVT